MFFSTLALCCPSTEGTLFLMSRFPGQRVQAHQGRASCSGQFREFCPFPPLHSTHQNSAHLNPSEYTFAFSMEPHSFKNHSCYMQSYQKSKSGENSRIPVQSFSNSCMSVKRHCLSRVGVRIYPNPGGRDNTDISVFPNLGNIDLWSQIILSWG